MGVDLGEEKRLCCLLFPFERGNAAPPRRKCSSSFLRGAAPVGEARLRLPVKSPLKRQSKHPHLMFNKLGACSEEKCL